MCSRRCLWALGFICSSLLAPALGAAAAKGKPAPPATRLEGELDAARKTDLYLVLLPAAGRLEVRARGMQLEAIDLDGVAVLRYKPPGGEASSASPELPVLWTVAEDPDQSHRKVIAPSELKPYSEAEQEEEKVEVQAPASPQNVALAPEPPASYRILLDDGWKLLVTQEPPATDLKGRLLYALKEGWQRLQGQAPDTADLLVLRAPKEQAQRIYHLFRLGTIIFLDREAQP